MMFSVWCKLTETSSGFLYTTDFLDTAGFLDTAETLDTIQWPVVVVD